MGENSFLSETASRKVPVFLNEQLDILIHDKHYATEIIENVIDNTVTCDDRIVENYPPELTMKLQYALLFITQGNLS